MTKRNSKDTELDSSDEDRNTIVYGTRSKYIDRIGGLEHGILVKEVVIVSDRRKPKQSYMVFREWPRFVEGMVWVPLAKVPTKDADDFLKLLIRAKVLVSTTEYPFNERVVKINWKTFPLKCVHWDCGR